jgi:hypothetical protein
VLTAKSIYKTRGTKHTRTVTIGSARFSIPAYKTTAVKIALNAAGRALLRKNHGRLSAHVAMRDAVPGLAG